MNFQHPARNRAAASAMCVASGFRRAGPAPTGGFINRDPRFELSRELAAQQTPLDQLHALAAEDPDSHARQSAAEAAMSGGVAASAQTRNRSNILRRQYDRMIDTTVKMAPIARFSTGRNSKVRPAIARRLTFACCRCGALFVCGQLPHKRTQKSNPGPCKEGDQHEDSAHRFFFFFGSGRLVAAFANEFGNMPQVKEITNGQPEDVVAFIERMVECSHWEGEEPYDKERAEQIRKAVEKARCDSLDSEEQALKRKYKGNKKILDAIGKAKELVT